MGISRKSSAADAGRPPGWYPDPAGSDELVYYDGTGWTNAKVNQLASVREPQAPTPVPAAPASSLAPGAGAGLLRPKRPLPAALRPLSLYAGAAAGIVRIAGRVSRAQYSVFLAVNFAITALSVNFLPAANLFVVGAFLITSLMVSIPRLHDTGKAGTELFWLPALALPLIGWLQGLRLLRQLFKAGQLSSNRYGPPPL